MTEPICAPLPCTATTAVPSPPPTAPSFPSPGLEPWAVGGFCLAALLISVGVAGVLFPGQTPRKWGN